MLYVGSQDSLVPFQPILKDDKYNHYGQPELMMILWFVISQPIIALYYML